MKNLLFVFMIPAFLVGCTRYDKPKDVAIKINNYEMSKAEFEHEFKDSTFGRYDTAESRKEFLDNLIFKILIVQDAQKNNLDNDPQFIKMIEKFWVQSLLKLTLDNKFKEFVASASVSDKAVEEAYQKMVKDGKTTKTYDEMYQEIKWDITKAKESQMMNRWLKQLHDNANIRINKDSLLKDK